LRDFSLTVPAGKVLVLLGPNGSGKTTTLKLISTMLLPDSGRVIVAGADTRTQARSVRAQVGFAIPTERSFVARLTARENLDFFAALDDVPRRLRPHRIDEMLARTGLLDAADTLVMKFSAGMYQRLAIARALLKDPAVLLLDEPTRSLDPRSAASFCETISELRRHGRSIVLATHSLEEAVALGDHVAVLDHGALVAFQHVATREVRDIRSLYFRSTERVEAVAAGSAK
jgi:ABC-2 type transport system ATP-binding protein